MAATGSAYNTDWVFSNTSNVHVACHRDWFTSFTPFESRITCRIWAHCQATVLGIGDVELKAKTRPGPSRGRQDTNVIVLRDVLYVPNVVCNILGHPIHEDYESLHSFTSGKSGLYHKDWTSAGIFDHCRLTKLWLVGQPKGQTSLNDTTVEYYINAIWPDTERERWLRLKNTFDAPPYTNRENAWLKEHYGSEFKFLLAYQLSIYKDEDREEGRRIARAFIEYDEGKTGTHGFQLGSLPA